MGMGKLGASIMTDIYSIKSMTLNYDGGLTGTVALRNFDDGTVQPPFTDNLAVWWRADALTGATVDHWPNEGSFGASWDLHDSPRSAALPVLTPDSLNGLPVVTTTSGDKGLVSSAAQQFSNAATSMYAVYRFKQFDGTAWRASAVSWHMREVLGSSIRHTSGQSQLTKSLSTSWRRDVLVRGSVSGQTNWWTNGAGPSTSNNQGDEFNWLSLAYAHTVSSTSAAQGFEYAEIMIFNVEHNETERLATENYLQQKWGV